MLYNHNSWRDDDDYGDEDGDEDDDDDTFISSKLFGVVQMA